jgi:threonyl-tRNA synthetase
MSSQTIAVHLPDGAIREVLSGTTPLDIANAISPRLAAVAVVARLTPLTGAAEERVHSDGQLAETTMYAAEDSSAPRLVDLATPLTADTRLELITEKDPEALKVVRHSAAHVLATAVLELFPETKLGSFTTFIARRRSRPRILSSSRQGWLKLLRAMKSLSMNMSRASMRWRSSSARAIS